MIARTKTSNRIRKKIASPPSFKDMIEKVALLAITLDLHGDVTFVNKYILHLLGRKRKEVIGRSWFDLFVPASSGDRLRSTYFQTILLGSFPHQLSYEIQNKQGKEHFISWTNAFLRGERGRILGLSSVGVEVHIEPIPQGGREKERDLALPPEGDFLEDQWPSDHDEAHFPPLKSIGENGTPSLAAQLGREKFSQDSEEKPKKREGKYLSFLLNQEEFGIGIRSVKEIIGMIPIRPLPQAPEVVRGVINLRGSIIPVVDLRLKFGMAKSDDSFKTCIVILEKIERGTSFFRFGIIVDTVLEVLNIKEDEIEDPPSLALGVDGEYILGLAKFDGKVKILLNMERVLCSDSFPSENGSKGFMKPCDSMHNRRGLLT